MYDLKDIPQRALEQIEKDLHAKPESLEFLGDITRFDIDKKNDNAGWVFSTAWDFNGKTYAMVTYGSWKEGFSRQWKSWNKQDELSTAGLTKSVQNARKQIEKEQEEFSTKQKETILKEFEHFKKALDDNFYIEKKSIKNHEGFLQDINKNLIIPIYEDINKTLAGYQKIKPKFKQFPTGQKVKGNFYSFGDLKNTDYIYVCEGVATGATIYETTKIPVVVAFQANNLPDVTKKIQHALKGVKIIIAADDDSKKTNAGMYWAKRAQDHSANIAIVKPSFGKDSELTDFNDLFKLHGAEETLSQLYFDESRFVDVEFLGFFDGKYYFYSTKTKELRDYTLEKLRAGNLEEMAVPSYWAQRFTPIFDKDSGLPLNKCNWKETTSQIVQKQNDLGAFKNDKIRGIGSWNDNGYHVLNLGDKLLIDGEVVGFGKDMRLSKFYKPSNEVRIEYIEKPKRDFSSLINAFNLIDFKSDRDRIIALGFVAYAQVFTQRRWRPHIWVRADKGTGKSSLLEFVNELLPNSQMFQDSTSAGVRQTVGVDSRVCLIDEAEGDSHRTKQIIELARQSSSGDKTTVARGTPTGSNIVFNPQLCFFFASIRAADLTPADESRIFQISMQKPKTLDQVKIKKMRKNMADASFMSNDFFSYMNQNIKRLNDLIDQVHDHILSTGVFDSRYADQHAPIVGAYYLLNPSMSMEDVIVAVCKPDIDLEADKDTDQADFFDSFLNVLIREAQEEKTLFEILADYLSSGVDRKNYLKIFLKRYGIEPKEKKEAFFISKNQNMINLLAKQTKYKNYYAQMSDNKFFEKCRSASGKKRGFDFYLSN